MAKLKFKSLRVAETKECARHVIPSGSVEKAYAGEGRILIASPKVVTYGVKQGISGHHLRLSERPQGLAAAGGPEA